jgi:hypothetical protein
MAVTTLIDTLLHLTRNSHHLVRHGSPLGRVEKFSIGDTGRPQVQ